MMMSPLTEHELAEVFVGRQKDSLCVVCAPQHIFIFNSGTTFRNRQKTVTKAPNRLYNLSFNTLIGNERHPPIVSTG